MKNVVLFVVLAGLTQLSMGQTDIVEKKVDISTLEVRSQTIFDRTEVTLLYFQDAQYKPEVDYLPRVAGRFNPGSADSMVITMEEVSEIALTAAQKKAVSAHTSSIKSSYSVESFISAYRKNRIQKYSILPFRESGDGQVYFARSFLIKARKTTAKTKRSASAASFETNSVLASGTWYKFGVTEEGVYKLDRAFLDQLGVDMSNLSTASVRVFGNGGGMLPINNSEPRIDDLDEIALRVEDGGDGVLNEGDYIAFYGQSPHTWEYTGSQFDHTWNLFSDTTYYFLTTDYSAGGPKRINVEQAGGSGDVQITSFDDYDFYERDLTNLIQSGKYWYGEQLGAQPSANFPFNFPNVVKNATGTIEARMAVRSIGAASSVSMNVPGTGYSVSKTFGLVSGGYDQPYASLDNMALEFEPAKASFDIVTNLNKGVADAVAWVDYIEVQVRRALAFTGNRLFFRDAGSLGSGMGEYVISGAPANAVVWDITDHQEVVELQGSYTSGNYRFTRPTSELRQFVAFTEAGLRQPQKALGEVNNQNLHNMPQCDMVIVTHPKFLTYAEDLGKFHEEQDSLRVNIATTRQIYNEYSSGKQDITAIRDFVRMFYERAGSDSTDIPDYLLLFGDASYDYKDVVTGNTNYVPSYQSNNTVTPTSSYVSDDFFGLLSPNEGQHVEHSVDIGIGRFPVQTRLQARNAVEKTKSYYQPSTFGSWRNNVVFVADDEDSNIHMRDADDLAKYVDTNYADYVVNKIFFDAYNQETTPGGNRYPGVEDAINRQVDQGALIINYVGHGGELGWAHERVLEVPHINSWSNKSNLPLFVTATCEFTRFDDPARTSAGEFVFLNPDGGGIALLTTTRLVFSTPNKELAQEFNNVAFEKLNGRFPRIGDLNRITKIESPANVNSRCFSLIGDPAVPLAYPKMKVITTSIPDTMKALQKVTVKGYVANQQDNKITNFNGIVYPTVFAQEKEVAVLNNDNVTPGDERFKFNLQNDVIFKGKASVENGGFQFTFVVPKDIDYEYGIGKVSYFSDNGQYDANGAYEDHQIGGISEDFEEDEKGPEIDLYLNDENFGFGGLTDQSPTIYAKLFDENGVNTVGKGIGHNIVAILDNNTSEAIVLNDYYESELDSYQKGTVKYKLEDLEEGKHTLKLKAWDVYNNSGEAYLEFVVARNEDLVLEHVLNYPNPFTTNTGFFFDHNQPGQNLQVRLQIFTVSGKLIKTIDGFYASDSYRVGPIKWNGHDEYGDPIGKGVYLYKLKVTTPTGKQAEKYEKLVILN